MQALHGKIPSTSVHFGPIESAFQTVSTLSERLISHQGSWSHRMRKSDRPFKGPSSSFGGSVFSGSGGAVSGSCR